MENEIDFISNDIKYKSESLAIPVLPKTRKSGGDLFDRIEKQKQVKSDYKNIQM